MDAKTAESPESLPEHFRILGTTGNLISGVNRLRMVTVTYQTAIPKRVGENSECRIANFRV